MLNSLTENVADVRKYLSVGALKLMAEKNPDQVAKCKLSEFFYVLNLRLFWDIL